MPKQPQYMKYVNITPADLGRMRGDTGLSELRKILTTLRRAVGQRKSGFSRAGVYSHAVSAYEGESMFGLPPRQRPKIQSLTRNQLIMEIVKAQKFFGAKTSTVTGARIVQRDVEKRLFGPNTKRHMTIEEQRNFWAAYNEYIRLHPDMYYRLGSDRIQKLMAEKIWDIPGFGTEDFDLGEALERVDDFLNEWEDTHGAI